MIADEGAGDADERARRHQSVLAGDLAREPAGPGEAVEQQAGSDADDEQDQEDSPRTEHGRDLLANHVSDADCRSQPSPTRGAALPDPGREPMKPVPGQIIRYRIVAPRSAAPCALCGVARCTGRTCSRAA